MFCIFALKTASDLEAKFRPRLDALRRLREATQATYSHPTAQSDYRQCCTVTLQGYDTHFRQEVMVNVLVERTVKHLYEININYYIILTSHLLI